MKEKTSWESSAKWYDKAVGEKGHYYHEHLILPRLLDILKRECPSRFKLLDLACGQGVLARALPKEALYTGVDASRSLIQQAKSRSKNSKHGFFTGDLTKPLDLPEKDYAVACMVLALQNIETPLAVLMNAASHLMEEGKLILVFNLPCFRIPQQTHWGVDEGKKLQYRRVDRYFSPLKIPIQTHPGKKETQETWTFHYPLASYTGWLREAGFAVLEIEEWVSDKKSTGAKGKMENRARAEIPLFMTLICQKNR